VSQELPPMIRGALSLELTGAVHGDMPFLYPYLASAFLPRDRYAMSLPALLANMEIGRLRESGELQPERHLKYALRSLAIATWYARHWTSAEALETVAARMPVGDGQIGVTSGAAYYFGRRLSDLTPAQCALLIVIVRSPRSFHPGCHPRRAREHRDRFLGRMREEGLLDREDYERSVAEPLEVNAACGSDERVVEQAIEADKARATQ
jgi:membrane peptidoglycan carboxypeptidase